MTDTNERLIAAVDALTNAVKPAPEPESEADFYRRLFASKRNEITVPVTDLFPPQDAA